MHIVTVALRNSNLRLAKVIELSNSTASRVLDHTCSTHPLVSRRDSEKVSNQWQTESMTINADAYWADKYRISHFSTTAIYQVIQYVHKYKVEVISMMAGNQLKTAHKTILPNHFGRG